MSKVAASVFDIVLSTLAPRNASISDCPPRLGADKKDPRQMKVVTAILDDLIEEGTFKIEEKRDDKRRPRQFVVPGVVAGVESL